MSLKQTRAFYDDYWPRNVPDAARTAEHVRAIVPPGAFTRALDAGCGTGVCSVALGSMCQQVISLDLSLASLQTARQLLGQSRGLLGGSLLELPLATHSVDLVFCWGVLHHTPDPIRGLDELLRVLRPGGTLVLAVYLRTRLTPLHELARWVCLRLPRRWRPPLVRTLARVVRLAAAGAHTSRDDNPRIESQVEDWFFVPEKHFFSPAQLARLFAERNLSFELLDPQTGRFRSSSNVVVRGRRG